LVNPGQELSTIDFASMIGGPLMAIVDAQSKAALSSVNFIKSVGFKKGDSEDPEAANTDEPIYVIFKYPKEVAPYTPEVGSKDHLTGLAKYKKADPTADPPIAQEGLPEYPDGLPPYKEAQPAKIETMLLQVPILTMLPIPFIRVEEATIDFNAKITSVTYQKIDTNMKFDAALEAKQRWPGGSAKLNVSFSYQKTTSQGETVDRTFSLNIHVKAVQDELPAGLEKLLSILEDAIKSQPEKVGLPEKT
jgi:hypothetical protein